MEDGERRGLIWRVVLWTVAFTVHGVGVVLVVAATAAGAKNVMIIVGSLAVAMSGLGACTLLIMRKMEMCGGVYRHGYRDGLSDGQTIAAVPIRKA